MRTPVVLVAGQGDTDAVTGTFLHRSGSVVVEHRFDGHVVRRTTAMLCKGELTTAEEALELAHGCVSCTVRNDLLMLLRKLARHAGVERIVVRLSEWLEPEPPDQVMWLESAGGGLRVASAGKWLAAMTAREVANVDAERRLFAELQWEYRFGDRHTAMTVLTCGAEPPDILDALFGALLTDAEMERPREWAGYPDPFGDWHQDPCDETSGTAEEVASDSDRRES